MFPEVTEVGSPKARLMWLELIDPPVVMITCPSPAPWPMIISVGLGAA
jgi:hypothetical protein